MADYTLPIPKTTIPLPLIDPFRHREAYLRILSLLYHAETAAMEAFKLLNDPCFVLTSDIYAKSASMLVADEQKHIEDLVFLINELDAGDIISPTPAEAEFWTAWRRGDLFALPLKPPVAALFCLFSEGLGYAVLYHLAQITTDEAFKNLLATNVEDEKKHLRLSITILRRAINEEKVVVLSDFLVYALGYILIAGAPARSQRNTLEDLGLPFEIVISSSFNFLFELLKIVVTENGQKTLGFKVLRLSNYLSLKFPKFLATILLHLPDLSCLRRFVLYWGQRSLKRAGIKPTDAATLATKWG